jgi:hypothetical protein
VTNIHGNVKPLTVFGGARDDVDNLGDTFNRLQGIQGTVLLENEPSFSTVNINDQGDAAGRFVFLNSIQRTGDSSVGEVSGLGAADIQWDYADTSAVNLNLGPGDSTVNVLGTGVTTNVFNSARAAIDVGNGGSVQGIQGALHLENEPSFDTVFINDQNDPVGRTATLATVTRPGDSSLGQLTGLAPAPMTWDYADTSRVTIFSGLGFNTFNIEGTGVATAILGGAGINRFRVSPTAHSLANIVGALTLSSGFGGLGPNGSVEFFDQNNPRHETYAFNAGFGTSNHLALATVPGFSCNFSVGSVILHTNDHSTVIDPTHTVIVT